MITCTLCRRHFKNARSLATHKYKYHNEVPKKLSSSDSEQSDIDSDFDSDSEMELLWNEYSQLDDRTMKLETEVKQELTALVLQTNKNLAKIKELGKQNDNNQRNIEQLEEQIQNMKNSKDDSSEDETDDIKQSAFNLVYLHTERRSSF